MKPVCGSCGSAEISAHVLTSWDPAAQMWRATTQDNGECSCDACGNSSAPIKWVAEDKPHPLFVVDGLDECENWAGDGQNAPFLVFDIERQEHLPGYFARREDAQIVAEGLDRMHRHTIGDSK